MALLPIVLLLASPQPARAEWMVAAYLGWSATAATTLTHDENGRATPFRDVTFDSRSLASPPYYGVRGIQDHDGGAGSGDRRRHGGWTIHVATSRGGIGGFMVRRIDALVAGLLLVTGAAIAQPPAPATQAPLRKPDVFYLPTPQPVVDGMLQLAKVTDKDVVYDLGCGDGRIPITAAQKFGARGVGIDIDPERIKEANENAKAANVTDRVKFLNQDLFESDFSDATVVMLYLLPALNEKLAPQLKKQLKPGARIVSHAFLMGDAWPPDDRGEIDGKNFYLWIIK